MEEENSIAKFVTPENKVSELLHKSLAFSFRVVSLEENVLSGAATEPAGRLLGFRGSAAGEAESAPDGIRPQSRR